MTNLIGRARKDVKTAYFPFSIILNIRLYKDIYG